MAIRLGILGSTKGTDMLALIAAIQQQKLAAQIAIVISNKSDALILTHAKAHGLATQFVNPRLFTNKEEYDHQLSTLLKSYAVDIIVLIGYMRILSSHFVNEWQNKIINVHPSLLPDFAGGMDQNVHQAVLDAGRKETGCTVHRVTEEVDEGPILIQKKCPILPTDTVESVKKRVQTLEGEALIEVIQNWRSYESK